jgi:DNA-binding NtrC family response regulator
MVLDDDADVRATLLDVLQDEGFTAMGFASGHDALRWLGQNASETKVVLTDLMIPLMSGDSFLTAKESQPSTASVPVIIMTGSGRAASARVALLHSVFCCLDKPLMLDALLDAVRACTAAPAPRS